MAVQDLVSNREQLMFTLSQVHLDMGLFLQKFTSKCHPDVVASKCLTWECTLLELINCCAEQHFRTLGRLWICVMSTGSSEKQVQQMCEQNLWENRQPH